jgi:hypothetical protein
MTIEADLWTAASAHLEPGEQIQAVFPALRSAPWKLFGVDGVHNYAVVATDRRIAVFRTSKWKLSTVDALLDELPRSHRFGAPGGALYAKIRLGTVDAWVHRRFWGQVQAADAGAPAAG